MHRTDVHDGARSGVRLILRRSARSWFRGACDDGRLVRAFSPGSRVWRPELGSTCSSRPEPIPSGAEGLDGSRIDREMGAGPSEHAAMLAAASSATVE